MCHGPFLCLPFLLIPNIAVTLLSRKLKRKKRSHSHRHDSALRLTLPSRLQPPCAPAPLLMDVSDLDGTDLDPLNQHPAQMHRSSHSVGCVSCRLALVTALTAYVIPQALAVPPEGALNARRAERAAQEDPLQRKPRAPHSYQERGAGRLPATVWPADPEAAWWRKKGPPGLGLL